MAAPDQRPRSARSRLRRDWLPTAILITSWPISAYAPDRVAIALGCVLSVVAGAGLLHKRLAHGGSNVVRDALLLHLALAGLFLIGPNLPRPWSWGLGIVVIVGCWVLLDRFPDRMPWKWRKIFKAMLVLCALAMSLAWIADTSGITAFWAATLVTVVALLVLLLATILNGLVEARRAQADRAAPESNGA